MCTCDTIGVSSLFILQITRGLRGEEDRDVEVDSNLIRMSVDLVQGMMEGVVYGLSMVVMCGDELGNVHKLPL